MDDGLLSPTSKSNKLRRRTEALELVICLCPSLHPCGKYCTVCFFLVGLCGCVYVWCAVCFCVCLPLFGCCCCCSLCVLSEQQQQQRLALVLVLVLCDCSYYTMPLLKGRPIKRKGKGKGSSTHTYGHIIHWSYQLSHSHSKHFKTSSYWTVTWLTSTSVDDLTLELLQVFFKDLNVPTTLLQ